MTRKVLILGGRSPAALEHARRFHHHGWIAHVADSIPCRLSGASTAVAFSHGLASPRQNAPGFVADLNRIVTAHRIDLLLPTCEEAFHVSRHLGSLPTGLEVAVDQFDKMAMLHSKWRFLEVARRHGLRVPESSRVRTLAEAREWAQGGAIVLKPEFSRFGVHVRLYPHGIPRGVSELPQMGQWVAQQMVEGDELCSYTIAHLGRVLAHASYRPAYRLGCSSSYYFDPVHHQGIREATAALARGTGYSGQISLDWIVNADGHAVALECNPRASSGLHLFPLATDLPTTLLGGGPLHEPGPGRARMIAPIMLGWGLHGAARDRQLGRWLRDWRRADDVIAVPGDRRPMLGASVDLGSYARMAARQRCSLREAATRDIEWDGESVEALGP